MKINELLKNTGVEKNDSKKFLNFTLIGFAGLIVSLFASCNKNEIKGNAEQLTPSKPVNQSQQTKSDSYNINKTTQSVQSIIESEDNPFGDINKNCGPTPGYPCGTKYYTVSIKDFTENY
ncbi:MAG: hypothetical protein GX445_06905 [Elusimicrobia bacterium]|jgi:hypothetical protein|nr:hypothetical protein [Elusimicrobiota bacterium]